MRRFLARTFLTSLVILSVAAPAALAAPLGTEFTYQGRLSEAGLTATGPYDFVFRLFTDAAGGSQVGVDYLAPGVTVEDGLFVADLDFGTAAFTGEARWLEIAVRPAGGGGYTTLSPRQPLTAAPYALYSLNGGLWQASNNNILNTNSGNVGIGSINPQNKLSVGGNIDASGKLGVGLPNPTMDVQVHRSMVTANIGASSTSLQGDTSWIYMRSAGDGHIVWKNTGDLVFGTDASIGGGFSRKMTITPSGFVGIGRDTRITGSEVFGIHSQATGTTYGGMYASTEGGRPFYGYSTGPDSAWTYLDGSTGDWHVYNGGVRLSVTDEGNVGVGTSTPAQKLDVNGTARVKVLEITGGADLSERFEVHGGDVQPGMVVVIDPQRPGQLVPASQSYDRRVAGIISGAGGIETGMLMSQAGTAADGKFPVALTGRVYCLVDASDSAIEPGDLLTTSDTPGHAMKVADHGRAQGAIVGKAMTSLAAGEKGLVLVLVNLQ